MTLLQSTPFSLKSSAYGNDTFPALLQLLGNQWVNTSLMDIMLDILCDG